MNALQFLGEAARLIGKLPPSVIAALAKVVSSVASSPDPLRAAKRAALAAASEEASEAAIRRALKALKR